MAKARNRPLSPHLQIWKWGPHMAVSILHRTSGFILATAGVLTLLWWLWAISGGGDTYATFYKWVVFAGEDGTILLLSNIFFRILGVVVSWAFFQHFFSGMRHLLLDTGAGYELTTNKFWSLTVIIAALAATLGLWLLVFLGVVGG